jgi:hypothetical protein
LNTFYFLFYCYLTFIICNIRQFNINAFYNLTLISYFNLFKYYFFSIVNTNLWFLSLSCSYLNKSFIYSCLIWLNSRNIFLYNLSLNYFSNLLFSLVFCIYWLSNINSFFLNNFNSLFFILNNRLYYFNFCTSDYSLVYLIYYNCRGLNINLRLCNILNIFIFLNCFIT